MVLGDEIDRSACRDIASLMSGCSRAGATDAVAADASHAAGMLVHGDGHSRASKVGHGYMCTSHVRLIAGAAIN